MHEDNKFGRCGRTLFGFLTIFSIGLLSLPSPSSGYGRRNREGGISNNGFITGQLMMFISIYYAPLHLALGRPHTITVLVLPYLLFHFFWNNHKKVFDYGFTTRNSMRNLSIQCVFLNNLIFYHPRVIPVAVSAVLPEALGKSE
ncbi:hypothetical protein C5167_040467 [Papaver somniferum]|uniref:Translocon at the inner envelope membrane of chloroplasts 214 n=1 Tax=Papaver somniferum TaxID=3469 RepID=A0A4Y7IF06_PAPSO|nr:hypothetical protein C5167_040467 [Papaver somniferum]